MRQGRHQRYANKGPNMGHSDVCPKEIFGQNMGRRGAALTAWPSRTVGEPNDQASCQAPFMTCRERLARTEDGQGCHVPHVTQNMGRCRFTTSGLSEYRAG